MAHAARVSGIQPYIDRVSSVPRCHRNRCVIHAFQLVITSVTTVQSRALSGEVADALQRDRQLVVLRQRLLVVDPPAHTGQRARSAPLGDGEERLDREHARRARQPVDAAAAVVDGVEALREFEALQQSDDARVVPCLI